MLADTILVIHFCVVIFVLSGFFLIPLGYKLKWNFTKNIRLRIIHLGLIALVTSETLLGVTCPLTWIEVSLRGTNQEGSFIGYWITQIIFWDLPPQYFLVLYCICLSWTFLMWKLYPPGKAKNGR